LIAKPHGDAAPGNPVRLEIDLEAVEADNWGHGRSSTAHAARECGARAEAGG
jgi:hypothetical protein